MSAPTTGGPEGAARTLRQAFLDWQAATWLHPLTCKDHSTQPLVVVNEGDEMLGLACSIPGCGYLQTIYSDDRLGQLLLAGPGLPPFSESTPEAPPSLAEAPVDAETVLRDGRAMVEAGNTDGLLFLILRVLVGLGESL